MPENDPAEIASNAVRQALRIETARVFQPLLQPARYKGAYGGRGSGKSHFFAGLLIEDSLAEKGLLSLSIREVQKSLQQSAKRLIEAKLADFRLGEADGFKVFREVMPCARGAGQPVRLHPCDRLA